ncbi:MAG: hypothetical protein AAGF54_07465 [Pseudomonadota bacterium]
MSIIITIIFWTVAFAGLIGNPAILIYLFFISMAFGSFAVLPTGLTGGLTLVAPPIVLLFIVGRTILTMRNARAATEVMLSPSKAGLLTVFWLVAVLTTVFVPRIFRGEVDVIPLRGILDQTSILVPTSQNFSQMAYLTISILGVGIFAVIMRDTKLRQTSLKALCVGGGCVVVTGVLDYLSSYLPIDVLLEPFRNASYALVTNVEVLGSKRVVGLMPEASSFGGLALSFLAAIYFLRHAIADTRYREKYAGLVCFGLVVMIWLSTSSSAYVGLVFLILVAIMEWSVRASARRTSRSMARGIKAEVWLAFIAFAVLNLVVLFSPSILDPFVAMVDRMVLQKTNSHSFEERTFWMAIAWNAFFDTYFLGTGVGSTRSSSAALGVLSNVGLPGVLLFGLFLTRLLLVRTNGMAGSERLLVDGAKWTMIAGIGPSLLTGTGADFGVLYAFLYGLILAVPSSRYKIRRTPNAIPSPQY